MCMLCVVCVGVVGIDRVPTLFLFTLVIQLEDLGFVCIYSCVEQRKSGVVSFGS
jgi:hypothetical protein